MNITETGFMKKIIAVFIILYGAVFMLLAQQKTVTGKVLSSEAGQPLAGAEVEVKGTGDVLVTGEDGSFSLNVQEGVVLVFRYAGMRSREITVGTSDIINVVLDKDYNGLENNIETGYGVLKKLELTGSISSIDGSVLRNIPVSAADVALQGKAAGLFVEQVNGKVAALTRIRIRGISSVYATSQPLFIVDGIPVTTESVNLSGAPVNPFTTINTEDIESVEILRDASSTAIYGARGANGVIIIKTKRGYSGDTRINLTLRTGFNEPSRLREFMNAEEYVTYMREAAKNGDLMYDRYYGYEPGTITFCRDEVENRLKTYSGWAAVLNNTGRFLRSEVSTDWQSLAFRKGRIWSADLSAQGGNDKLQYSAGSSVLINDGILVSNGIEKISARLRIDNKVSRRIDLGFSLRINRAAIDQVSSDNYLSSPLQLVAQAPVTPPRDADGELSTFPVTSYYNALLDAEYASKKITEYRSLTSGYINFNIIEGLTWKNELGFDLYGNKENARYGEKTMEGMDRSGYGFANHGQNQNITGRSLLLFNRKLSNISLNTLLGTEFQHTSVETMYTEGERFASDALKTIASAGIISGGSSTLSRYGFLAGFLRVNTNYDGKYLLSLSGRIEGSSRFGSNNKYGFFPGISAGWIMTGENFMQSVPFLSFLKIKAGYGLAGNAGFGNYWHLGLYDSGSYGDVPGLIPGQMANPDLKWESLSEINTGVEFGFLKDRISGEIDIYQRKATNILLGEEVPSTTGYLTRIQNSGAIQNKGLEFVLNTVNITGLFEWKTSLNFSLNKNKVLSLGKQNILDFGGESYMNVAMTGYPIGSFYGAEYAGVDYNNGDALWYINEKDANGNIINPDKTTSNFNSANFIILGNPNPDFMGAITNALCYKGLELIFTFQGVAGNKIHLAGDRWMASNGVWFDNQLKSQLRSWKSKGDITDVPQARLLWDNGNQSRSSRYLSDGSYLKLREVSLSYDVPSVVTNKLNIRKMQLFIQGRNLFTFSLYEGWDPEVSADFMVNNIFSGFDFYSAPQPRTIVFGITLGF